MVSFGEPQGGKKMSRSILKKTAVVFSIVALGFFFQNCSGGGSGTGGGSGAGPNSNEDSGPPPPEISVNAFPGTTADELGIPEDDITEADQASHH